MTCLEVDTEVIQAFRKNIDIQLKSVAHQLSLLLNVLVEPLAVQFVLFYAIPDVIARVIPCVNPIFGEIGFHLVDQVFLT